jgi:hypothetical protein
VFIAIKILQRIFEIHKKQVFQVVNDLINELVALKNNEELFLHKEEAKRMKSEEVYSDLYNKVSIFITDWEMIAKSALLIVLL